LTKLKLTSTPKNQKQQDNNKTTISTVTVINKKVVVELWVGASRTIFSKVPLPISAGLLSILSLGGVKLSRESK
jgi:hypothetical protein